MTGPLSTQRTPRICEDCGGEIVVRDGVASCIEPGSGTVHGKIQRARGMCTDEASHVDIDIYLSTVVGLAKDLEAERERLRVNLERLVGVFDEIQIQSPGAADALREARRCLEATNG